MTEQIERPDFVDDEHLEYLDNLRSSGSINMLGAGGYLRAEFDLDSQTSGEILTYWMNTFGNEHR